MTLIDYLVDKNIKNAVKILGIWLIPHAFSIALNLLSNFNLYNGFDTIIKGGNGRYVGLYGIATAHGLNMTYVVVISLFFYFISKKFKSKFLFFVLVLSAIYSLMLSVSFSAILLLGTSIILVIWFCFKQRLLTRLFLVIGLFIFGITYLFWDQGILHPDMIKFAPEIFAERIEKSDGEVGSSNLRMALNKQAIEEFIKNPIFGIGADQFNKYNDATRNVHNTLLSSAVETGVFGLIGVLIYLLLPSLFSQEMIKSNILKEWSSEFLFMKFLFVLTIIRIAQTAFSGPFIQREAWIPFLLIFALYSGEETFVKKRKTKELKTYSSRIKFNRV